MKNILPTTPQNLSSQIDYQADSIISKVLYQDEKMNLTLFAVGQGQEFSPHTTTRKAIVHIVEGEGQFMLGDDWHDFKMNDYFFMEENTLHAIKATRNFKFLLYLF